MSTGETLVWLYGVGFIIALLHMTNVNLYNIADRIYKAFLWPLMLLYFAAQFVGYVTFSAIFCVLDWFIYPTPINLLGEVPSLEYNKEKNEKRH